MGKKSLRWFIVYNSNTTASILLNQIIIVKWKAKWLNKKNKNKGKDENEKKIEVVHCDNVSISNFLMFLLSMCEFAV
jgi:hypothetical protein